MSFRDHLPPHLQAMLTPEVEAEVDAGLDAYAEAWGAALRQDLIDHPITEEEKAFDFDTQEKFYSESQTRDDHGRWTSDGGPEFRSFESTDDKKALEELRAQTPESHLDGIPHITITDHVAGLKIPGRNFSSYLGAYHWTGSIAAMRGAEGLHDVIRHEVGHNVHLNKMTPEAAAEWKRLSNDGKNAHITAYARTNRGEHFAEAYMAYRSSEPRLRERLALREPAVHAFMDRLHMPGSGMLTARGETTSPHTKYRRYDDTGDRG